MSDGPDSGAPPGACSSYHFRVIRRAIEVIDRAAAPLSLDALAQELSMSPAHFQRLFSQWVGVSPKRYQQYLMLEHARDLLRRNFTTLDTVAELGLSGAGRLHDMFLRWEAMSPGEFSRRGEGLDIRYGYFPSPFGEVVATGTDRGLCGLGFTADWGRARALDDLVARWPRARFTEQPDALEGWVSAAFGDPAQPGKTRLHLIGAPFQIKVWEALLAIPPGHVTTYSEIARAIGSPRAVRAVGTAVGRNPVSVLIPCHRVLRRSGALGGYHWGVAFKRALLARESARRDAATPPGQPCRDPGPGSA